MESLARVELAYRSLGGRVPSTGSDIGVPRRIRTLVVVLEGRLPSTGRDKLERKMGIEPTSTSLATKSTTIMRLPRIGCPEWNRTTLRSLIKRLLWPLSYRASNWSGLRGSNSRSSAPKADAIPLGYTPKLDARVGI